MRKTFLIGFLVVLMPCALAQGYGQPPPEETLEPTSSQTVAPVPVITPKPHVKCVPTPSDPDADCIIGIGGKDYPIFRLPKHTKFNCSLQKFPGIYADPIFGCQVFYNCQPDHRKDIFICPRGTILNQKHFVCDWYFNVNCTHATSYYALNEFFYIKPTKNCTKTPNVTSPAPSGSALLPTVPPTTVRPSPPTFKPYPQTVKPYPLTVKPLPPAVGQTPTTVRPSPPTVRPSPPTVRPSPPTVRPSPPTLRPSPSTVRPYPPTVRPSPPTAVAPSPSTVKLTPQVVKPSPTIYPVNPENITQDWYPDYQEIEFPTHPIPDHLEHEFPTHPNPDYPEHEFPTHPIPPPFSQF